MLGFVENSCLSQMVSEPMHDNNIIDLALVTRDNLVENITVGEHLRSCYHRLVRFEVRAQISATVN